MRSGALALVVIALVGIVGVLMAQQPTEQSLETGIRQVQEGEFETAIITLDGVVRRLSSEKPVRKDVVAKAYAYLSVAYFALGQEQTAKEKFAEGWKVDPTFEPSASEFPPRYLKFLQEARKDAIAAAAAEKKTPATAKASPSPAVPPEAPQAKKGGSKTVPILLGVAGAAGAAVAVSSGGGGGGPEPRATPAPTPTPTPTPARNFILTVVIMPSADLGSVELSPPGGTYAPGTRVTATARITAPPRNVDRSFAGWTGCDAVSDVFTCTVTMDRDRTITATFQDRNPQPVPTGSPCITPPCSSIRRSVLFEGVQSCAVLTRTACTSPTATYQIEVAAPGTLEVRLGSEVARSTLFLQIDSAPVQAVALPNTQMTVAVQPGLHSVSVWQQGIAAAAERYRLWIRLP
jgi:hypothetical protein